MATALDVKRWRETMQDKTAVVGIGETEYTKYGGIARSEFTMACEILIKACDEAGLDIKDIDGFSSYSDDRNNGIDIARYVGIPEVRWNYMNWGGGGGGGSGALLSAAVAVATGACNYAFVFRSLNQGQWGRFGQPRLGPGNPFPMMGGTAWRAPHGIMTPPDSIGAMWGSFYMGKYNAPDGIWGPIAVAARRHANNNPHAVMYGRPMSLEDYMRSRWIAYPMRLLDCCLENDCAAGMIVTTAERAKNLKSKPVLIRAAAQGSGNWGDAAYNNDDSTNSNFTKVAETMWARAEVGPKDVQVHQSYENFTSMVLQSLETFGFLPKGEGWQVIKEPGYLDAPNGKLPLNTCGGNLSHAYVHGIELIIEAVRQCRGDSPNPVPNVKFSSMNSGPGVQPVSCSIFRPA